MCGIAGFTWEDKLLIRKMSDALAHRGPDDSGIYADRFISLGHRRLSIIDLSNKGHQPMTNEDSSIIVVFNGEIWNFSKIRSKLVNLGHKFMSDSDTEVIVHGYEEHGEGIFSILEGMFAFALWDSRKKKLFLVRDRIGKKPLYYFADKKRFIFASEIKSILVHESVPRSLDNQCISDYLSLRYSAGDRTIFSGIRKVSPGTYLEVSRGEVKKCSYWSLPKPSSTERPDIWRVDELIENSVKKRLMSDVPIGVFLSGGLDSSTIVAYMKKFSDKIQTFSVGFGENTDETSYAEIVANKFNTEHTNIISDKNIIKHLPKVVYHLDEPLADPAALPTYVLTKTVAKKVKVAISGEGGDEVFGGYHTFNYIDKLRRFNHIPRPIRKAVLGPILKTASTVTRYPRKQMALLASEIAEEKNLQVQYERLFYFPFNESEKKSLFPRGRIKYESPLKKYIKESSSLEDASINYYFKDWLPNDLLMKADKLGMAHGLEVRVPFLDNDLINYFLKLDHRFKKNRYLFKKVVGKKLPPTIIARKKQGFTLPLSSWFSQRETLSGLKGHIGDLAKRGLLDPKAISKIIDYPDAFRADHKIWTLLNLELWSKIYLDDINPNKIDIL